MFWGGSFSVRVRKRPDLLDRAETDAIGFAQGAVDRPSLGHAHLGTADKLRDIGWVGVAVADETSAGG